MIHRQPVFLPRTTGEILNWINGRMMALGMRPGTFYICDPVCRLPCRKLGKVSDLRALFLLISADAFGVAALLSGYTKVCSYGFSCSRFCSHSSMSGSAIGRHMGMPYSGHRNRKKNYSGSKQEKGKRKIRHGKGKETAGQKKKKREEVERTAAIAGIWE